jgi:hypothetical protein
LVEEIPPVAVRLRRDVGMLLTLIRTHSVLHQATRKRDEKGRVIAEMTDYTAVYNLIADLVADGVGATVTREIRETIAAVQELAVGDRPVSVVELARRLKLDKSSVSRRVAKDHAVRVDVGELSRPRSSFAAFFYMSCPGGSYASGILDFWPIATAKPSCPCAANSLVFTRSTHNRLPPWATGRHSTKA